VGSSGIRSASRWRASPRGDHPGAEQEVEGVPSVSASGECLAIDNTFHPANKRLNLATAVKNLIACFGIRWDDATDRNGHFASFGTALPECRATSPASRA
jgi:hypothetical protein